MILVNLLPEEMRRIERTPLPRLLSIILGSVLVLLSLILWTFLHFNVLSGLEDEAERIAGEIQSKTPRAQIADKLNAEIATLRQRRKTIVDLKNGRRLWWVILDELSDIIPDDMWITSLSCGDDQINLSCMVDGADGKRASDIWLLFKTHPTFGPKIAAFPDPFWTKVDNSLTKSGKALQFNLTIKLKPMLEEAE